MTVTPQNLSTLARADRVQFFPGSQQKKFFLENLFNQLQIKTGQLTPSQRLELLDLIKAALSTKDLQLNSTDPALQSIFTRQMIAGAILAQPLKGRRLELGQEGQSERLVSPLKSDQQSLVNTYLYLVESNVGINKANKEVVREVKVKVDRESTSIKTTLVNNNQEQNLAYINYQRLIFPVQTQVSWVKINGQLITNWSLRSINNSQGQEFMELGFLLETPAAKSSQFEIELSHPQLPANPTLLIQKQPGLTPTPYSIEYNNQEYLFNLGQDTLISL